MNYADYLLQRGQEYEKKRQEKIAEKNSKDEEGELKFVPTINKKKNNKGETSAQKINKHE